MNSLKGVLIFYSRNLRRHYEFKNIRPLFSSSDLGLDSFLSNKKMAQKSLQNPDLLKRKLKEISELENKTIVFSDDIFKMLYLVESDNDLDILHKLLHKICLQNKIKIEKYRFGTEVMRLYHLMNKPTEALTLLENEVIFSELQSINVFTIFLDLLFKNGFYKEIINMYNYRHLYNPETFSYRLTVLYFGACYKLNTNESYDLAVKKWQNLVSVKRHSQPGIRIRLFLAALSLKQNYIDCAIELLLFKKFDSLNECIKCMGFAKLHRFNDIFERIREILNSDLTDQFFMPLETVNFIEEEVQMSGKEINKEQFKQIKEELINTNHIAFESLDHFLCAEVKSKSKETKIRESVVKEQSEAII